MPAPPFEGGKNNTIRGQIHDHRLDRCGLDQGMIDKKQECARRVPGQLSNARLK